MLKEIAAFIHEGAQAFLKAEYKILLFFVAVLFVLIGFGISWVTAVAFLVGAVFSTVAGYCGMSVATKANVRTAAGAMKGGMNKALSVAFSGGAVMGPAGKLGLCRTFSVNSESWCLFLASSCEILLFTSRKTREHQVETFSDDSTS